MTEQTRESRVLLIVVFELRVVSRRLQYSVRKESAGHRRFRNRVYVTRRHGPVAKRNVALGADKLRALVSFVDLVIERSTVVQFRSDVTALGAAARFHRHLLCRVNRSIE